MPSSPIFRRFSAHSKCTEDAADGDSASHTKDVELCPVTPRRRLSSTQDNIDRQRMGKRQELNRKFQFLSTVGFASCVLGT
ncbi:hypothetical protein LTR09_006836 [Extremus antarcticus]|uniref:Uncharacterized protein n=1 Tax=Extremus antarcticus TaxID=702011 RepID=A0AAJ0G7C6_9PEZI|nr:hypothetical protein LTR09_006836 [Extremus antarcticus]